MEMCRFAGPDDNEYRKVAAALTRAAATRSRDFASHHTQELTDEQKQGLLDSLRFDHIDARHMAIKTAHAKTCRWLLQKSEYLDWCDRGKLAEHNGFLWIKGKPGAGKSTLMKFALANTRRNAKDEIVLSFFFNARGDDLEKSTSGLFRSLLVQLLEQVPSTKFRFSTLGSPMWKSNAEWTLESLQSLFEEAVLNLRDAAVICFVDALDECDEQQIRDMVYFFERLGEERLGEERLDEERLGEKTVEAALPFRVCFASRHYPHITMSKGHNLVLEDQEGHEQDIVNYLSAKLKIGNSKLAEQARAEVRAKASGNFLWVVVVTDSLNRESDAGGTHNLKKRVDKFPDDLHELLRTILTRDASNKEELLLCIQWVLFARKPLTPTQLYFAVLSGVDPDVLLEWDRDETSSGTIAKYLLNCSKGLTKITKSERPTVQFSHEYVRDFLLEEDGLRGVWSYLPVGVGFQAASHDAIKECCLNSIRYGITDADIPDRLPKSSSAETANLRQEVGEENPILEYATHQVLHHAEAAAKRGSGQEGFLNDFPLSDWMRWQNIFAERQIRRYDQTPSLLYVLAERGLTSLIELLPPTLDCLAVEDQRYGVPVVAASVGGHQEALQTMLERISATLPPTSPFPEMCKEYLRSPNKGTEIKHNLGIAIRNRKCLVGYLLKHGTYELLLLLLSTGKLESGPMLSIPLHVWAKFLSYKEGKRAATALLDLQAAALLPQYWPGALYNSTTEALGTALILKHPAAVKHLLAAHADKSLPGINNRVHFQQPLPLQNYELLEGVLCTLARAGVPNILIPIKKEEHLDVAASIQTEGVAALLQSGAYVEATKAAVDMALMTLITHGDGQVVSVLSVRESSFKARNDGGRTPVIIAAEEGQPWTIDVLLRLGADIEAESIYGTALLTASRSGHGECIELLCSRGANTETRVGKGETPLMLVLKQQKNTRCAASLLKWGACVHVRDMDGRTPLMLVVRHKKAPNMLRLLLDNGADIHAKDKEGRSALAWAARWDSFDNVKLLLDRGADIHAKDKEGLSPLAWAARCRHPYAVQLLLERGANREDMDWVAMKRLHGEDPNPVDGENHEPFDQEDAEKDGIETPTVCEVCIGRRSRTVAERAAAEAAAAEAAASIDETSELDEMNELDGTGDLDEMDESGGTSADGL